MTLRVVETYASYQGEGPNTSQPTVFVRFAGCNFKCPGWPCDTQHAIQPKLFMPLQKLYAAEHLSSLVSSFGISNVCLTGGEVFLQPHNTLKAFLDEMRASINGLNVECFTNGGLRWGDELALRIDNFILDWKLPGSGEEYDPTHVFEENFRRLNGLDAVKFTIKNRSDYDEAKRRYFAHIAGNTDMPQVYCGVVWGAMATEELCRWMLDDALPWQLNVQVHKFVWSPNKIGV